MRWLCLKFNISTASYYNYLQHKKKVYYQRKHLICKTIKEIYHSYQGILGYRKVKIFLEHYGIYVSVNTVRRYMQQLGLQAIVRKKKYKYPKSSNRETFPNLLQQHFIADTRNQIWCTDITEVKTRHGISVYNCAVIDLYNKEVVASEYSLRNTSELTVTALLTGLLRRNITGNSLIIHSDRGSQFSSSVYTTFCRAKGIRQSMSRPGTPYDNAVMERYFSSLKTEYINQHSFATTDELIHGIADYVIWYNHARPHAALEYKTPYQYCLYR